MAQAAAFFARRGVFSTATGRAACLIVALVLFAARTAFALDIFTTDGHLYRQCEIEKVEPDALRILHADGAARIPYEKLPASLQKQYFDPAKVEAYRQQFAQEQQAAAAKAAEAERLREEAATREDEQRREQDTARQHEEDQQRAAAQAAAELRLAAEHHKREIAIGLIIAAGAVVSFLYFLPTIIARHKANALAIFVFNLFFGWSGIGWIAALVWACTSDSAMDMLAREQLNRRHAAGPPPPPPSGGTYTGNQLPNQGPPGRLQDGGRYLE